MQNIIVDADGDKCYHNEAGQFHRENGPAVECDNGDEQWFINGELHREDGPAIECVYGYKEWWLNGEELTEEEFQQWRKDNNK